MALRDELLDSQKLWPPGRNTGFIPIDALYSILTFKAISEELSQIDPSKNEKEILLCVNYIYGKARKLFALLLCQNKSNFIYSFIEEGIYDEDLPFQRAGVFGSTSDAFRLCSKRVHVAGHEGCGIKAMSRWSRHDIRDFCGAQWVVQAPVFEKTQSGIIPHYDLDKNVIMPFIEDDENQMIRGGYSHVWKVRIHPAHQTLWTPSGCHVSNPCLLRGFFFELTIFRSIHLYWQSKGLSRLTARSF